MCFCHIVHSLFPFCWVAAESAWRQREEQQQRSVAGLNHFSSHHNFFWPPSAEGKLNSTNHKQTQLLSRPQHRRLWSHLDTVVKLVINRHTASVEIVHTFLQPFFQSTYLSVQEVGCSFCSCLPSLSRRASSSGWQRFVNACIHLQMLTTLLLRFFNWYQALCLLYCGVRTKGGYF